MGRVIFYKGEVLAELGEDEEWHAGALDVLIVDPADPESGRTVEVPDGDVAGLVEGFVGGA